MIHPKKKILLIDDDPSVSDALQMLLRDEFDTHSAATVRDGVRLFDSLSPNAVILDLHLPDSHGLEALRSIRSMDRFAPVIILTGFATLEAVEESLRLGASDCLHKPFDASVLKSRLRELTIDEEPVVEASAVGEAAEKYDFKDAWPEDLASSAFLHDISNPLTSLMAFSTLLKESFSDSKKCEELSGMIFENISYLSSLIQQWRSFSEPDTLEDDCSEMGEIADQAIKLVQLRAEAKGVAMILHLSDDKVRPSLNQHAVVRILVNLLQNAIEAVERDTGKVNFHARMKGGSVEFIVHDNGCGIAPALIQKIFQPRYTTKKKGTGLGLYIARTIVESAKGAISICSRPGRGTSFTVQLPKQ
ncbi:ATPase, histidine kinase-, DNA gyrase B-, and HSP90-like domain protein [Verrucomicrobiia bacterium DG1235]|nr:ATPase, histidine kinase-, DNA gyrase B-, and HSP90-like domain protein [Verrucomicrobiae bacterium DG1235]